MKSVKKYKFTILYSILTFVAVILVLTLGDIETGPQVFLPGYDNKTGEVTNENVKNLLRTAREFGGSSSIVIVVRKEASFFENAGDLKLLHEKLEKLPYVSSVLSAVNLPKVVGVRLGTYLDGEKISPEILEDESGKSFVTEDGRYALLNVTFKPDVEARKKIDEMKKLVSTHFRENYFFGEAVIDSELFRELVNQTYFYPLIMFVLVFLLFYYQLGSLRATVFSLFVPVLSTLVVFAGLFLTGVPLNSLTAMTPSFLLIIGSAYGLHFYNAISRYEDKREGVRQVFKPILFSMLTTLAGFLSFVFIDIKAFRELGILVSCGLALVVLAIFTSGVELFEGYQPKRGPRSFGIKYYGKKASLAALFIFLAFGLLSTLTLKNVEIGSDMVEFFSRDSEVRRAHEVITKKFNLREPVYLVLEKDTPFLGTDSKTLKEIKEELETLPYVSSVVFPVNFPVPLLYNLARNNEFLRTFIGDRNKIRFIVNLTPQGYDEIERTVEEIGRVVGRTGWKYYVAGAVLVWNDVNKGVLRSQIQSLVLAAAMIFGMVLIVFRNLLVTVSVMTPLLFTTLFNFMFMWLFKIKLDISTSITSSILMGLVVDYSIHIAHEGTRNDPLDTLKNVGPAIMANALGLIAGFSVLLFSKLSLFKNVATLMMLGIAVGAIFTLIVQPLILKRTSRC